MKTVYSLLVAIIIATATVSFMKRERPAPASTLQLGLLLCLSGECAEPGTNARMGAELAAEEINARGGVLGRQVDFAVQDTEEMAGGAKAVAAYRSLRMQSKARFIIGPTWTVGGLPLVPILAREKDVVITSPSLGVADFNERLENAFNIWPHDSVGTEALARHAVERGWKRAAILSNQGPWESAQAKVFKNAFEALGGTIVAFVEPAPSLKDLRTECLTITSEKPDVVFMSNYTQMDVAAKELRQLGYQGAKLAILMDETRLRGSDGALDGTIYAIYPKGTTDFAARFRARYHTEPGIAADTGYDAVYLYAKAIEAARSFDPVAVRAEMAKLKWSGASGDIAFDGKRGVTKQPVLWSVRNSRKIPLDVAAK